MGKDSFYAKYIKRILDILCALAAMIVFCWLYVIVAILVRVKLGSPVLFKQVRPGKDEKLFTLCKFRTMTDARDENGELLPDDVRLTKFGRFLRSTSLDELPEAWNILKGDMSIVGPRPERPFFVKQFIAQKPEYDYRHNVKPGITGLAQIAGKYNTSAYDKLIYDLLYIQDVSVKTDLMIMLQTFKVLLTKSSTEGVQGK